jgi:hypothetical protein
VKAQRDLATLPPSIQTSSAKKGNIDAILFDGVYKALKTENIQVFYIFIFPTSITFSVPSTLIVLIGNFSNFFRLLTLSEVDKECCTY